MNDRITPACYSLKKLAEQYKHLALLMTARTIAACHAPENHAPPHFLQMLRGITSVTREVSECVFPLIRAVDLADVAVGLSVVSMVPY